MKKIIFTLFLIFSVVSAQKEVSGIAGMPGAFSRMGFGARGTGMGNAMSSVTEGSLSSYYNPALPAFQEGNNFYASYSFLSLDRSLNFLGFTRKFSLGEKSGSPGKSIAGFSAGIINSGVSDIDGRDNQGMHTKNLSTSENLFFFGFSNRFSEKFAIGLGIRFYYYSLYEDVTSTGVGMDLGFVYLPVSSFSVAVTISDINSSYKWDTTGLYGQEGTNIEESFPVSKKIGLTYKFNPETAKMLASVEYENINSSTNYLRAGVEYDIYDGLYLRGGIDKINISNFDEPAQPAFGFSYIYRKESMFIGIDYAFAIEPYSSHDKHILGLNFNF